MYVVLGGSGQVGRALAQALGDQALVLYRQQLDLADPQFISQLNELLAGHDIRAVINAAAYTQVDQAEGEGRQEAEQVNHVAVAELAHWCKQRSVPLVHYSTDYVFDGSGEKAWSETSPTNPINAYGAGKLAGEKAIQKEAGEFLIFRTSWVYDAVGKNFFNTMRRLFRDKEEIRVVSDQVGAPTYAPHLAQATLAALNGALGMPVFPSGIYHLCGGGSTSWRDFAQAIFTLAKAREPGFKCKAIHSIASTAYPTPAKRPANSRMDCAKARETFGIALPPWEQGLKDCVDIAYGH